MIIKKSTKIGEAASIANTDSLLKSARNFHQYFVNLTIFLGIYDKAGIVNSNIDPSGPQGFQPNGMAQC